MPLGEIKLHIGGKEGRKGWTVLDIAPGAHVDIVGNCNDLSALPDACCAEIYASHVLEHLAYDGEVQRALAGFHRVLAPGGRIRVSVPDMETLCKLFLLPNMSFQHRYQVMRSLFGGRTTPHDVHYTGMFFEYLGAMMHGAGFRNIERVPEFGEFKDASSLKAGNVLVSLNVQAMKQDHGTS
ncbi:MAG: methyltransferase domain-containing protein [Rhodospirillaceae bacterium]